jgi:hypothetical protein
MMWLGTKQGAKAFTASVHSYSPFSMALSQFCSFFCGSVFYFSPCLFRLNADDFVRQLIKNFQAQKISTTGFGISKQFAEFHW